MISITNDSQTTWLEPEVIVGYTYDKKSETLSVYLQGGQTLKAGMDVSQFEMFREVVRSAKVSISGGGY